ncbi:MAG: TraR/DksA family transcriptional regulator [Endomicrobia bacterium]|nr:TraR/DksA family transcriptional regulator [Endomicrobiia bacterium]MCX7940371.1 TraR/DksA family transcriptional regulator [Endomicrobiia bacterium]MDW8056000.1 TraR/DksA family transcriptional regulator [Elusimicrobiota bacterium]
MKRHKKNNRRKTKIRVIKSKSSQVKKSKKSKKIRRYKFSPSFIKECKEKLLQKYKELTEIQKKNTNLLFDEVGDEADIAGSVLGQEMQHELSDTQRNLLYLISIALEKIDKGEYGICEGCKKTITKERLKVLPWARYCIKCQNNLER